MANEIIENSVMPKAVESKHHIEPEMQSHSGLYPIPRAHTEHRELLEPIMTQAFISQPVIGNVIPTDEQREWIHMLAERILSNARRMVHLDNMGLDSFSRDIIVLATVLILRNWNDEGSDKERLWEYICNQFALPFDDGSFANSPEYKMFREAITFSLRRHNRLSATTGQKYYTTLLIHSLAPKAKFHDLFEQVFNFYAKNLHYHYLRSDPAFSSFAYAMKSRFEATKTRFDDDLSIKSVQSSIAIKQYFLRCPKFMSTLLERIVRKMDTLVATGAIDNVESDYIDALLVEWHEKRSREERTSDRKKRTEASTERVVTDFGNIRISYIYELGKVSLVIPSIRLGEEHTEKPQITMYRYIGDENPYVADLRYYGNYICITSSKIEIPLNLLMQGLDVHRFEYRAVITYGGKVIFDSGTKLFRKAIIFCESGTETLKRPENEYVNIFTQKSCVIEGLETAPDCFVQPNGSNSIYRILIDKNTCLTINGEPLYPVEQIVSGLTLRLLVPPVSDCKYAEGQHEYHVFSRQPVLEISSNKPQFEKQYRLAMDNNIASLSDYYDASNDSYKIPLPPEKGLHGFRIIDNVTHQRIYELPYIVFENFSLDFNGFYFTESYSDNGNLSIHAENKSSDLSYALDIDRNVMLVSYEKGDLEVDIPILRCLLDGQELTEDVGLVLWHNEIPSHALLDIEMPRGYFVTVIIGSATFESCSVEIGNIIRTNRNSSIGAVGLILRRENERPIEIKLFDIAFEPYFKGSPVITYSNTLQWSIEENFVGDKNTEFEVHVQYKDFDYGKYKFGCDDAFFDLYDDLLEGVYQFTVYAKQPGFFSKYELLLADRLIVGEPEKFWFDGCAVIVTEAIIEDDYVTLNHSSGIIVDLCYIGEHYLNGETQHYPCYEGKLFYKNGDRLYPYATAEYERNGKHHEQVNPVKLWVVNEFTISLRTPADDGLYVHKGWSSITDRKPPTKAMNLHAANWLTPDYYHYKIIPQSEVQNV